MRTSRKLRPRLEGIESRALLSGVAAAVVAPPASHTIHLNGTLAGSYAEHQGNPDFPKVYTLSGSGHLGTKARTTLAGSLQAGGFTANPGAHGTVRLAEAHGSITVNLTASPAGTSDPLEYAIVGGTGAYKGAIGSGSVVLTLDRNKPPRTTTTGHGGFTQHGTFDLAFAG